MKKEYEVGEIDLQILEQLAKDGNMQFKQLAEIIGVDQRTIAKRVNKMKESGIIKVTVDIDWSRIGIQISAYVGSTTALGDKDIAKLFNFIRHEPRIVEAYATIGTHEYFLKILEVDLQQLREDILRKLEPLTADLVTSVVSTQIKSKDYSLFLRFLRERDSLLRKHSE
jgi:DNA-binding Lrp family transcriptional regulator